MYQSERMDEIMKIVKKNHYVTVDYLVKEIKYSPASIRRDLTVLEKQGLVTRSYGGVTFKDANNSPFKFRQHSMKTAKHAIAAKAASLVKNGDVVFVDGSSTAQYLGRFLLEKKGIIVITCNMILADFLSENGIETYCTGGKVVEYPGILGGDIMINSLSSFNVDIAFFASTAFSPSGQILAFSEAGVSFNRALRKCSKKLVYLCGSDKIGASGKFVSFDLNQVDYFISDKSLDDELKQTFENTTFLCT